MSKKDKYLPQLLTNKIGLAKAAKLAGVPKEEMEIELIRYVDMLQEEGLADNLGFTISQLTKDKIALHRHLELTEWLDSDREQHNRVLKLGELAGKAIESLLNDEDPDPKEIKTCIAMEKDLQALMASRVNVTKETTPLIHQTINTAQPTLHSPEAPPLPTIEDVKGDPELKELPAAITIASDILGEKRGYEDVFESPSVEGLLDDMELEEKK